jgi:hypothetical protein
MENALWGFIGVFIGTILTVTSQFLIARMQLNQQSIESRRNRLIDQRKDYLISLRDIVAEWVICNRKALGHYVTWKESPSGKEDTHYRDELAEEFKTVYLQESDCGQRLDIMMNHCSDGELVHRIRQLQDYRASQIDPLYRLIMKTLDKSKSSKEKLSEIIGFRPIQDKTDDLVISINARIEQLLCGD